MKKYTGILVAMLFMLPVACTKNNLPKSPSISLISMTPDSIKGGSSEDTVYILFHLADGAANLGNNPNDTFYDIYVKDSRYDTFTGYFFPAIDPQVQNPKYGIEGTCTLKLLAALIIPRDTVKKRDTLSYELYITDRNHDTSNHIKTGKLYVTP